MITAIRACLLSAVALSLCSAVAFAQSPAVPPSAKTGPVIRGFGGVYDVPGADFKPAGDITYKTVFSVRDTADTPSTVNRNIESAARFLNMEVASGVARDRIKAVVVLHGAAARDALSNEAYRTRFGVDNPNLPLIAQLREAGVDVYLCGQTAAARGLARKEVASEVKMALSALTVMSALGAQGYTVIQ